MKTLTLMMVVALAFPVGVARATSPLFTVSATSQSQSIAQGAQRVAVLTLSLKNSCLADQTPETVVVHHRGLGSVRDIGRVYAMKDGKRLTRPAVLREDGTAVLRFRNFTIPDCKEAVIDIAVDFSADAAVAGQHFFTVDAGSDIVLRSHDAVTLLPSVQGRTDTAAGDTADSAITIEHLPLPFTLTYGAGRILARVRLDAEGRHDQMIRSITFTNRGSARDHDLQNLFLQRSNGTAVSETIPGLDGRSVTLTLNRPLVLGAHDSMQILLRGDVRASRRRTVQFVIEEPGDIDAVICTGGRTCDGAK